MKVGILTLPLHINYGGILQAYALQTVLKRMGYDAILLDQGWIKQGKMKSILSNIKWFLKSIGSGKKQLSPYKIQEITGKNIKPFILKNIHPRINIKKTSKIKELQLDAIIVGSDQVWRKAYSRNIGFYFLDFAKQWNIKRIAYAASFGINEWDYSKLETIQCKELLKLFTGVSVREKSGQKLCHEFLDREATLVLDPTLLLNMDDYMTFVHQDINNIEGNLLCYILDRNTELEAIINKVSSSYKYTPYFTNINIPSQTFSSQLQIKPSIEFWLKGFANAELIITDSFHGCVFSILFNKPFFVYANKERGIARFESLLSLFNLTDRMVTSIDEIEQKINSKINWEYVNKSLEKLKQDSLSFLKTYLS